MADETTRLDGNAAAGLLQEVFGREMTAVEAVCAGCGDARAVGALVLYGHEMGAILRCPGCDAAMIRVSAMRTRYWLDLRGAGVMKVNRPTGETAQPVVGE